MAVGEMSANAIKWGEIAGQLCDVVVITDVNCFDEDPAQIAEMLAVGARRAGKKTAWICLWKLTAAKASPGR